MTEKCAKLYVKSLQELVAPVSIEQKLIHQTAELYAAEKIPNPKDECSTDIRVSRF